MTSRPGPAQRPRDSGEALARPLAGPNTLSLVRSAAAALRSVTRPAMKPPSNAKRPPQGPPSHTRAPRIRNPESGIRAYLRFSLRTRAIRKSSTGSVPSREPTIDGAVMKRPPTAIAGVPSIL